VPAHPQLGELPISFYSRAVLASSRQVNLLTFRQGLARRNLVLLALFHTSVEPTNSTEISHFDRNHHIRTEIISMPTQILNRDEPILDSIPMDQVDTPANETPTDWLWTGLIARGNVTLLTSLWKAGKTTLLTGLMQRFATGGIFLDLPVEPAKVLVVSEESRRTWAERLRRMPVGPHCRLLSRPFRHRPTAEAWNKFVDHAIELHAAGNLDLIVIDPLAKFLPGSSENDLNSLLAMLDPLQPLTEAGAGVLILHHPRKKASEEGNSARGSGGLLASVDIILELSRYGKLRSDDNRRKLFALSRYPATPRRLFYAWDPTTGQFTSQSDPHTITFNENWVHVHAILAKRKRASTHQELLMDWPVDQERPSTTTLYAWLNRAFDEKRIRREGSGRKDDPYRYRLEDENDKYWDRGELPPVPDLDGFVKLPPRPARTKKAKAKAEAKGDVSNAQ
jgi:AAA domain